MCDEADEIEDDEEEAWRGPKIPTVEVFVTGGRINRVELVAEVPVDWNDPTGTRKRLVSAVQTLTDIIPHASLAAADEQYRKAPPEEIVIDPETGEPKRVRRKRRVRRDGEGEE